MANTAARRKARLEAERLRRQNYTKWWLNERLKDALWDNYMAKDQRAVRTLESVAEYVSIQHDEEAQTKIEIELEIEEAQHETAAGIAPE